MTTAPHHPHCPNCGRYMRRTGPHTWVCSVHRYTVFLRPVPHDKLRTK